MFSLYIFSGEVDQLTWLLMSVLNIWFGKCAAELL